MENLPAPTLAQLLVTYASTVRVINTFTRDEAEEMLAWTEKHMIKADGRLINFTTVCSYMANQVIARTVQS